MHEDRWGLSMTVDDKRTAEGYNEMLADFLEYRLSAGAHLKSALSAEPEFPMGLCMRGYMLMQLATHAVDDKVDHVIAAAEKVEADANQRERRHIEALRQWRRGDIEGACRQWRMILDLAPQDLLALRLHHFMSFWRGDHANLHDAPAAVLDVIEPDLPGYGFVLGMHAFGLEECANYGPAEDQGREAVARNANDLWAIHAVAHVMEMQGRQKEGCEWLDYPDGTWSDRSSFKDHVWWHAALFAFNLGDNDRVLDLYDREIKVDEGGFYLDVQNAASLLMRLALVGIDVGDRWEPLANLAEQRTEDHAMAFTDLHYLLALVGDGRLEAARHYLGSLRSHSASGADDVARIAATHTIPIAESLLAFGEDSFAQAADGFERSLTESAAIGGSHAQQDIFRQIQINAATRAGNFYHAGMLLERRAECHADDRFAELARMSLQYPT